MSLVITVKSISMSVRKLSAITTVTVLISSVTTAVDVGHVGLADIVTSSWGLCVMVVFVKMEVSAEIPMTRITTHASVDLVTLGGTVSFSLFLVTALHVNKVEIAQSLLLMTSNVIAQQVS